MPKHVHAACRRVTCGNDGVGRQEGCQVALHADGAHAWTTAPVGDAEGLVQVQMAHVCSNDAGGRQADLQAAGTWGCSKPCDLNFCLCTAPGREQSNGDMCTGC